MHGIRQPDQANRTLELAHRIGTVILALEGQHRVALASVEHVVTPRVVLWVPADVAAADQLDGQLTHSLTMLPVTAPASTAESLFDLAPSSLTALLVDDEVQHQILQRISHQLLHGCDSVEHRGLCLRACGASTQALMSAISSCEVITAQVPCARSEDAEWIAQQLRECPADSRTAAQFAAALGVSSKTVQRSFQRETGMTFSAYRQRARALYALERLTAGTDLAVLGAAAGYTSASAFAQAFRQQIGMLPSALLRQSCELIELPRQPASEWNSDIRRSA